MLEVVPIPAYADNYIWLLRQEGVAVAVDPGESEPVLAYCQREGLALAAILVTHHHRDHVDGILPLRSSYPEATVFAPAAEPIPGRTVAVGEGGIVELPALDLRLAVLAIPGHTLGHVAYVDADNEQLFCGDTLFAGGCGRLFEGSPLQMYRSLQRLAALPETTQVYCAHEYTQRNLAFAAQIEPDNKALQQWREEVKALRDKRQPTLPSTIARERAANPFLRCETTQVIAAASAHAGHVTVPGVETFAALRRWKDVA